MPNNSDYSSESGNDYSKDYSSNREVEYSSTKSAPKNETDTRETSYDLAKPRRIIIKARLLND
jgi:hypothetical protein